MPHTHHRTWQKHRVGYFSASVHLDRAADGPSLELDALLADVTRRLIDVADAHRLPITWAVSDPSHSAATSRILRSTVDHELAILGDASWLGPTAGRTRFARELARRVSQARAAGIDVTTLVPRVTGLARHIDLVVKHQITAISGVNSPSESSGRPAVPRAIHYGVWELPITRCMPVAARRYLPAMCLNWTVWRQMRRTAMAAAPFHLAIDAPALADRGPVSVALVSRLLGRVAELRNRGLVAVETLRQGAARLSAVPTVAPQQSILRRAA